VNVEDIRARNVHASFTRGLPIEAGNLTSSERCEHYERSNPDEEVNEGGAPTLFGSLVRRGSESGQESVSSQRSQRSLVEKKPDRYGKTAACPSGDDVHATFTPNHATFTPTEDEVPK
jgi:hypothetical protein